MQSFEIDMFLRENGPSKNHMKGDTMNMSSYEELTFSDVSVCGLLLSK